MATQLLLDDIVLRELLDELKLPTRHNTTVDVKPARLDLVSQLHGERRHPRFNGSYRPGEIQRNKRTKYDENALVIEVIHERKQPKVLLAQLAPLDLSKKSLPCGLHCLVIGHRAADHADVRTKTVLEKAHHMNVRIPIQLATTVCTGQPRFQMTLRSLRPNHRRAAVSAEFPCHRAFERVTPAP
jgi:hypothetical protein